MSTSRYQKKAVQAAVDLTLNLQINCIVLLSIKVVLLSCVLQLVTGVLTSFPTGQYGVDFLLCIYYTFCIHCICECSNFLKLVPSPLFDTDMRLISDTDPILSDNTTLFKILLLGYEKCHCHDSNVLQIYLCCVLACKKRLNIFRILSDADPPFQAGIRSSHVPRNENSK